MMPAVNQPRLKNSFPNWERNQWIPDDDCSKGWLQIIIRWKTACAPLAHWLARPRNNHHPTVIARMSCDQEVSRTIQQAITVLIWPYVGYCDTILTNVRGVHHNCEIESKSLAGQQPYQLYIKYTSHWTITCNPNQRQSSPKPHMEKTREHYFSDHTAGQQLPLWGDLSASPWFWKPVSVQRQQNNAQV